MYIVKAYNLPFEREFRIYENWVSNDKQKLKDKIVEDLESDSYYGKITLTEKENGFLIVNNDDDEWLELVKLEVI